MSEDQEKEEAMTTVETNGAASTAIQRSPIQVGARGIELRTLDEMWRFAQFYASSGLAPKGMDRPESILIAMQAGQELGLGHFQSVQSIAPINGRPCLWGDTMKGLVLAHPSCEYINEWMEEDENGDYTAWCESKRRGSPRPHKSSFSQADAVKAGLWNKSGPWTNYPKRMLQVRARAFNLRDNFADVLRGLSAAEEMQDVVEVAQVATAAVVEAAPVVNETRTEATRRTLKKPEALKPEPPVEHAQEPVQQQTTQRGGGRTAAKAPEQAPPAEDIEQAPAEDVQDPHQVDAREFVDSKSVDQLKSWFLKMSDEVRRIGREAVGVSNFTEANEEQIRQAAFVMRIYQLKK